MILRTVPGVLAALLLGAHFLRGGAMLLVGACLLLAGLAFVRRPPIPTLVRVLLVLGALEWAWTGWEIWRRRTAMGEPALRAALILAGVAAFTLLAAWLLPGRRAPEEQPAG